MSDTHNAQLHTNADFVAAHELVSPRHPNLLARCWTRFVAFFWSYTEETGKSDTSSFRGLL